MNDRALIAALRWQQEIDAGSVDWTALTQWLETADENRAAFNDVAQIAAMIDEHGLPAGNTHAPKTHTPRTRRPRRAKGTAAPHEPAAATGVSRYSAAKPI